ncbi:MAG: 2Fe-2S iron-sulfur cluster-binding protein [Isosphaeraceae bacterium]|nr:2Fe-2S iron-sulfur cluster-binding protein [Isosphaeraceae bacterium]
MVDRISIIINGSRVEVARGTTVAAAVAIHAGPGFRRSVSGRVRGPLCGMGICFECRLTIDGRAQSTSCRTMCREDMEIQTDD